MVSVERLVGNTAKNKLPKILTKEQLIKMLRKVDSPHVAMAMFMSIFFGLRISEMSYSPRKKNHVLRWSELYLKI